MANLIDVLRGESPLDEAQAELRQMLEMTHSMLLDGTRGLWGDGLSSDDRASIYERDIRVNQFERSIRERVTFFLAGGDSSPNLSAALRLMSIVKDVERIGDYAKNLAELVALDGDPIGSTDEREALMAIAQRVEALSAATLPALVEEDGDEAQRLYEEGRAICRACDDLIVAVARSEATACDAVRLAVGARHYKRVAGHLMNVLSGLLMPLHKLDFFDEEHLAATA
jgi:phosphate uptake regulator